MGECDIKPAAPPFVVKPGAPSEEGSPPARRLGGVFIAGLALVGFALLILLPGIGLEMTDRDEAWYSQVVREMRQTGDWLVPRLYGEVWLGKPPMLYWLAGVSTSLFGWGEWQLRLVPVLAGVANVLLVAWLGARLFTPRVGLLAAAIFITLGMATAIHKMLLVDGLLLTFILLAVALQWRMTIAGVTHLRAILHGVVIGLGMLTKGPVILIFAGAFVLASWLAYPDRRRTWLADWRWWAWGGLFAAIVGLPWYAYLYRAAPDVFLSQLVGYEMTSRLGGRNQGAIPGFPGAYLVFALFCLLPWTPLVPGALRAAIRNRRTAPTYPLLLAWVAIPWLFLELISGKVVSYTLPCYTVLAILLAARWATGADAARPWPSLSRGTRLGCTLTCLPMLAVGLLAMAGGLFYREHAWAGVIVVFGALCAACFLGALLAFRRYGFRAGGPAVLVAMAVTHAALGGLVNPSFASVGFSKRVATALNAELRPGEQIVLCGYREPTLPLYTQAPIRTIDPGTLCEFVENPAPGGPVLLAVYERDWQALEAKDATGQAKACLARALKPRVFREVTGYTIAKSPRWQHRDGKPILLPERMYLARVGG